MAQIIRKLEKGNKIKKYENPAKELDFSASAITGNSNNSNSNSGITDFSKQSISGNSQTSNLDFSANSIIGKPKPETPKTITFKKNGQNTNWTIDDIKNMMVKVQDRTLANKQLNTKESTEANNWLLQQIQNAKESVDITNKGIYIDGIPVTTPEAFYEGYDGLLRKKYSKNYAGDLLARQAGAVLEGSNNSSETGAGSRYSPFDLPTLSITATNNSNDSDDEKTDDQLVIEAFNKEHKTIGAPKKYTFEGTDVYRFDLGNGNYALAKKGTDGSYSRITDNKSYIFDDSNNPDFGNIFIGIDNVYRLINENNVTNESEHYKSTFNKELSNILSTIGTNYQNRIDFYNQPDKYYSSVFEVSEELPEFKGTPIDILDHVIPHSGNVKSLYIDSNSEKPIFGRYVLTEGQTGRIVVIENGKTVAKDVTFKIDGVNIKALDKNGQEVAKFTKSDSPKYASNWKDENYTSLNVGQFDELGTTDIHDQDIKKPWFGNERFELPGSNDDNYDEYQTYATHKDFVTNIITALETFKNDIETTAADKYGNKEKLKEIYNSLYKQVSFYPNKTDRNYSKMLYLLQNIYDLLNTTQVQTNKKGGSIPKYQSGDFMKWIEQNKNAKVQEYNNTPAQSNIPQHIVGKENATFDNIGEWSGTDIARATAVGLDAASLAGGVVGFGAGLAATAVELGADIADYQDGKISGWDLTKNAALNLGFTLLAIVPGLASAKIAKTAVKGGAKVAKSLKKVEKIAEVANSTGVAKNVKNSAKYLTEIDDVLKPKDIDNIINAAGEIMEAVGKNTPEAQQLSKIIDQCKAINTVNKRKTTGEILSKISPIVNAGMAPVSIVYGGQETWDTAGKILSGDVEDISLQNIQGIVALAGGVRGARQMFRNYAIKKGVTDIDEPTRTSSDNSPKEVTLTVEGKDVKLNVASNKKGDVKLALKRDIENLNLKKSDAQTRLNNASDVDKPRISKEIKDIEAEIKLRKDIQEDFDNFYKEPNKVKTWAKDSSEKTKNWFSRQVDKLKPYDYSNKKLIENDDNLSWIQKKGRQYAIREGFTEDGFDPSKIPYLRNSVDESEIWNLSNKKKRKFVKEDSKRKETQSTQQSQEAPNVQQNQTTESKVLALPPASKRYLKHLQAREKLNNAKVLKSSDEVIVPEYKSNSLTSQSINKVLELKNQTKNFNKPKDIKQVLKELKKLSKGLSDEDKFEIMDNVFSNQKFNRFKKNEKLSIEKLIESLKKGGSVKVKKYDNGNAFSSAEDPTKDEKELVKIPNPNEVGGSNDYDGQISKPNNWWSKLAIVPEAINIASKTVNAWAGANKVFDIQQRKEAAKLQYPYLHLPVQEDLAGYQSQKDAVNEGKVHLNRNLTSDASLQQATNLEYNTQALKSIGQLNALRSQDLKDQRLRSFNQEYTNEQNRINVANQNNAIDVSLADYKRGLDAQRINTLTSIINTNLDQNGQLFNKMLDSATRLQAAKYKDALTQKYYDKTAFDNDYITRYDTYEKSPIKQYETALGIGKDEIVTQAHIDGLYNKYLEQHPNLTDDQKRSVKAGFDRLVGKTLQQYYDSAYKYHETNLTNEGRKYQSAIGLADVQADVNKYFLTPSRFNGVPSFKKGGSFIETKYKTDAKSKEVHKKIALEYAKLMQKQHQENMKNALPFLLHSYKNTTSK